MKKYFVVVAMLLFSFMLFSQERQKDWRYMPNGNFIHKDGYVDQPYVVILDDGSWLVTYTTSEEHEGSGFGQHIACRISKDHGKTWSETIRIEEPGTESSSWSVPYKTRFGRVYVFYDHNGDKIHELGDRKNIREDMFGWYCYKYSDDNGKTWSKRYRLPMRKSPIDLMNQWGGDVQIFWGVSTAVDVNEGMMFGFTRIGEYCLEYSEGWFYYCKNINEEKDPGKLEWELLPEGDYGLRSKDWGSIQSEHCVATLNNGDIYSINRTTQGNSLEAYSKDDGKTWTEPTPPKDYLGRDLKNPRGNTKVWRIRENGKYVMWFHNNGTKSFYHRNPVWVSGGIEKDGKIIWSQPEIMLYKDQGGRGASYADLIQQDGRFWLTETEKRTARTHEIPAEFFEKVCSQHYICQKINDKPIVSWKGEGIVFSGDAEEKVKLPQIEPLSKGKGFTVRIRMRKDLELGNGTIFVDSRDESGKGFWITKSDYSSIKFSMSDGVNETHWNSDLNILQERSHTEQEITVIVDFRARVIMFVTDGVLNDGKNYRPMGWGWIDKKVTGDISTKHLTVNRFRKEMLEVNVYDKPLMVTDVIGAYRYWQNNKPKWNPYIR